MISRVSLDSLPRFTGLIQLPGRSHVSGLPARRGRDCARSRQDLLGTSTGTSGPQPTEIRLFSRPGSFPLGSRAAPATTNARPGVRESEGYSFLGEVSRHAYSGDRPTFAAAVFGDTARRFPAWRGLWLRVDWSRTAGVEHGQGVGGFVHRLPGSVGDRCRGGDPQPAGPGRLKLLGHSGLA